MSEDGRWDPATREGSRRARIRQALRLTVRERLAAMAELWEEGEVLGRSTPRPVSPEGRSETRGSGA